MLRFNDEDKEFEKFVLIDQNVQDIIKNLRSGNDTGLVQFFQENFINKVINTISEN